MYVTVFKKSKTQVAHFLSDLDLSQVDMGKDVIDNVQVADVEEAPEEKVVVVVSEQVNAWVEGFVDKVVDEVDWPSLDATLYFLLDQILNFLTKFVIDIWMWLWHVLLGCGLLFVHCLRLNNSMLLVIVTV